MKTTVWFCCIFFVISCSNISTSSLQNTSPDSTIAKQPNGYNLKQIIGVFSNTLPCADCPGIATQLYLKPDSSFIMEQHYLDRGYFYQTGRWIMNDSLLQLNTNDTLQQFKMTSHATLALLDKDGKEVIMGSKKALLHRNNIPFKPFQPIPVEGMFSIKNNTMNIHICTMKKDFPAAIAPGGAMMKPAYEKASPNGESVYAKVAGHFELRPFFNDTTTRDFFVIEKFIRFLPNQSCQ